VVTSHVPRGFDPVRVGNFETDAWAAYYRREWRTFLMASIGMVAAGFGMNRGKTLLGAWLVLRANQKWAPYPDNDPDAARDLMRRFYALVARGSDELALDPARASRLELETQGSPPLCGCGSGRGVVVVGWGRRAVAG
jgi:hypothetical protein